MRSTIFPAISPTNSIACMLVVCAELAGTTACSNPAEALAAPQSPDRASSDHSWTERIASETVVVLLAGSPERPPFHADSSVVHTVADLIVRSDDQRRDGIDLCCNVVMDTWDADQLVIEDNADPSAAPLFVGFFGAAYAEGAPEGAAPAGYVAQTIRPWERPGLEPGSVRTFDGFATPDELFRFANGVVALPLVRVSWEATLNPPGEGEGEGEGE